MVKMIKVREDEWWETKTAASKVKGLQSEIDSLKEMMQEVRRRWNVVFPASRSELEAGAIATIQQELGLPRLIEEARATIQSKARELSDKFVAEIMMDSRWKEIVETIREDINTENIEQRLAELFAEKLKDKIDSQEIARAIADALLENGDVDLDAVREEVEDRLTGFLEENISVELRKGGG